MMKTILTITAIAMFGTSTFATEVKKPKCPPSMLVGSHKYHVTEGVQCPAIGPTPCVGQTVALDNQG